MTDDQPVNQILTAIESRLNRLEGLEGEFREQASFLVEGLLALSTQTTNLANRVDNLTSAVNQLVVNAEADRAVMREMRGDMRQMQAEIQQIWQYLLSQRPNGQQG